MSGQHGLEPGTSLPPANPPASAVAAGSQSGGGLGDRPQAGLPGLHEHTSRVTTTLWPPVRGAGTVLPGPGDVMRVICRGPGR